MREWLRHPQDLVYTPQFNREEDNSMDMQTATIIVAIFVALLGVGRLLIAFAELILKLK